MAYTRRTILSGLAGAVAATQQRPRTVTVDGAKVIGKIRSLQGVNVGPAHTRPGIPDLTRQYKDLRIDSVRTHDFYGPTDIDAFRPDQPWDKIIFPHWDADPEKEESYNFGPSDRLIKAIVDSGAEVYFRLGRSWGAVAAPPADFDKFANICKHVVMHYNAGWANGTRCNIRYWEFWNEPDGRFWSGSPEQFHDLYDKTARVLKAYDAGLMVGTCALAGGGVESPYREGLIKYCADHRVPLDFYSWHRYSPQTRDPYDLPRIALDIRRLLDAHGFKRAESHLTEWNLDPGVNPGPEGWKLQDSMLNGAFTATALIYLQDVPVERAHYYRGDGGHPMGLFRNDGSYKKKAYAYKATGLLLDTPQRLAASGADTYGFAVIAGRSADRKRVQVLIGNYEIHSPRPNRNPRPQRPGYINRLEPRTIPPYKDNQGYALAITNLPWGKGEFTIRRYRVSETENFDLAQESSGRGGTLAISNELQAPAFELMVLRSTA